MKSGRYIFNKLGFYVWCSWIFSISNVVYKNLSVGDSREHFKDIEVICLNIGLDIHKIGYLSLFTAKIIVNHKILRGEKQMGLRCLHILSISMMALKNKMFLKLLE